MERPWGMDQSRASIAFAVFALAVACQGAPPPASPPPPAQTDQQAAARKQQDDLDAQMKAAVSAQRDQVQQAERAYAAQQAEQTNAYTAAVIQADADKRAAIEKERAACAQSRDSRAQHARGMIAARLDAETRLLKHGKAIRAACRVVTRKTGAVNVTRSGSSLRIAPELAQDVSCSGLPQGVSKEDAWVVLSRAEQGIQRPTGPILESEDYSPDDSKCHAFDLEVGLDFASVQFGDGPALERLLRWRSEQ